MKIRRPAVLLALALCLLLSLGACGGADTGIVGSWQGGASVLGDDAPLDTEAEYNAVFSFGEDMKGTVALVSGEDELDSVSFNYSLADGVLTITYDEYDRVEEVPYRLENGQLILTIRNTDYPLDKVS